MPSLYDFYSPYVAVSMTLASGEQIPLWSNAADAQPAIMRDVGMSSLSYVTEVTVKTNLGALPEIVVILQPPFREGIKFLDSDLIEWGRTKIGVEFGYSGGTSGGKSTSNLVTGLMMQPSVSVGADINITLRAFGSLGLAMGERNFVEGKTTRKKLMQRIIQGPDPDHARTLELNTEEAESEPEVKDLLTSPVDSFHPSHRNDLDLLATLAAECKCWIYLSDSQVVLIPRNKRLQMKPKMFFSLMDFPQGKIGPEVKRYPILGFQTPNTAIYLPGALRSMVARGIKSSDRQIAEITVNDDSAQPVRVGPHTGAAAPADSPETPGISGEKSSGTSIAGDGGTYICTNVSDPDATKRITAEFEKMQAQFGIEAHVDSLGIPDLFPGDVVTLNGLGKRINGTYGVFEVTHSIGASGFSTRFVAWSNVMGLGEKYGIAPKGDINTKEPDITGKPGDFEVSPDDGVAV
jgi:hypothetical protein